MRRKLLDYTVCLIAGIISAFYLTTSQGLVLCIAGMVVWSMKLSSKHAISKSALRVIVCLSGMLLMILTGMRYEYGVLHEQCDLQESGGTFSGIVTEIERQDDEQYAFTVKLKHEKILCSYYAPMEDPWALLGCSILFYGEIQQPEQAGNPRCFDYRLYLRTRGIGYITTIENFRILEDKKSPWYLFSSYILQKREGFLSQFDKNGSDNGILRGILFGDTNRMDEELYDCFRQSGTAHVLAVSGLHVGMLYGIYRKLYERIHHQSCTWMFLFLLFIYGMATLWSVSVTRAIILICLIMTGELFHRRYDLLTALAAVALIVIVRNPYIIFGAEFQMSFLAVASIIFLQKPMEYLVGRNLSVSMAVQAGLLPYMAYVFNYVSFVGIVCNLPVVFLVSLMVPIGMAGFVVYFLLGQNLQLITDVMSSLADMLVFVNQLFSADGWLSFDVVSPPLWMIVFVYGVGFYGCSEQARVQFGRRQWREVSKSMGIIAVMVIYAFAAGYSPFDDASLVFVDVGQGDCVHIKSSSGHQVFVDGGGTINYDVGKKILKPYCLKNGISQLDLAAATHLHTDHYLGLTQLAECFDVRSMVTRGKAGDVIRLNEDEWVEILWPITESPETEDENLNSLIFMVHQRGMKTLITGDITAEGEAMLMEYYDGTEKLRADILKIAHHGSAYSTSDEFLEAVDPRIAVISVGKNNYGHPAEIVIEKLEKKGIIVFRTDQDGAVGMINRKGKISVCTENRR